jgi:hypothetical protein
MNTKARITKQRSIKPREKTTYYVSLNKYSRPILQVFTIYGWGALEDIQNRILLIESNRK